MDLSEVTKLEKLQSTTLTPDAERKELKMLAAVTTSIEKLIISSYAGPPLTREAERALLLRLADALEAEPRDVRCVQVRGTEHLHTESYGWLRQPLISPLVSFVDVAETLMPIKVEYREQLVHYVCALGKLGVVLGGGNPSAWRGLGIPTSVRELIIGLNDNRGFSFAQIAAALRSHAAQRSWEWV